MGDVDRVMLVWRPAGEFGGQGLGAQVQAALGKIGAAVAEGGFYHQQGHIQLVEALPQGGVALGVAGVNPVALAGAAANGVTDGGHGVHG